MLNSIQIDIDIENDNISTNSINCSICLSSLDNYTRIICGHIFHKECIDTWNKKNNTCPLCRSIIIQPTNEIIYDNNNNIFSTIILKIFLYACIYIIGFGTILVFVVLFLFMVH